MCCPPVLILSVGNILFTAEGIGVQAVNHLRDHATLSPGVELLDGGTLGGRLMDAIMSCRRLIVLDAVLGNSSEAWGNSMQSYRDFSFFYHPVM